MSHKCRLLALTIGMLLAAPAAAAGDTYAITLDPAARTEPANGRVILFFISETVRPWPRTAPIEGPFFKKPQPIASIAVNDFKPGATVVIDGTIFAFPDSLDKLGQSVRVQAILDADQTERSHTDGPGNVFSDVMEVKLSAAQDDYVSLTLTHRIDAPPPRQDSQNLKWVRVRSELLSKFHGRDIFHRAGVALPKGYHIPGFPRQRWPAIYVIPGFGGRDDEASNYHEMLMTGGVEAIAPIAVYVVLDPELPLGHHGFADSANNGPVATALVTELIPYLESQVRLVAKPEARLVTGHSSGGWSSLWLQLNHPEVFGGCWSSAPDPIDFTAFQMTNIYDDASMYANAADEPTPSMRGAFSSTEKGVLMTVRQEAFMEYAIDPNGRSGQQWDAWEAAFSPRDDQAGAPRSMFDPLTGAIDKSVVEHWSKFDITRLLQQNWEHWGPLVDDRVRIVCGDEDSYYLNRAVERFKAAFERLALEHHMTMDGPGYVLLVQGADHGTIDDKTYQRWNKEMREYLQAHGLQDLDAAKPPATTAPDHRTWPP